MVIFRLDTPGGLDTPMRDIIKDIIGAPMPVVVYVSPNGARAASAGLYITQAADVAAMAPQTNIGSATPISIGPGEQDKVLGRKIRNDAAAYVRALAEGHGRNPDLAEEMVRKATNVTASEAKARGLIDVVATDQQALLRKLDGFHVKGPKAQVLHTKGARVENRDIPFKYQVLELLVNPNTVFLLFTLGLIGIGFELFHPGAILPGALGAVSLIIALYGLAQIPISVAGLLLILLAFGLFVAEAFIVSHGALAAGGVIALIAGGLLLFDTGSSAFEISVPLVIFTAALLGSFFAWVISKAVQARHGRVRTGTEELIGEHAVVRSALDPVGHVFVQGALWRAAAADSESLSVGEEVVVESVDGLTLKVRRAD
jgi:membrane-bound serine protease (ClpP class)